MKKFILFITMAVLILAANAQSHYTVWHPAKAVTYIGSYSEVRDASVILNTESEDVVRLSVSYGGKVTDLSFKTYTVFDQDTTKTTWWFQDSSTMTMFHTGEGDICKLTVRPPDGNLYDVIVFLFYM